MLTDSLSPHNDLQNLRSWLELPETQEVLKRLKELSLMAQQMALASPQVYLKELDGEKCDQLRHQFIGNWQGLHKVETLLEDRLKELEEQVLRQDNANSVKKAT